MSNDKIKLELNSDETVEFPVYQPTYGYPVIDVRSLGTGHGYYTFDPGFLATAACESKVTYINGAEGVLLYGGYPIEPLAEKAHYVEIIHLLIHGELPNQQQFQQLSKTLAEQADVPTQLHTVLKAFPHDGHPMAMLMALVTTYQSYYGAVDLKNADERYAAMIDLIAKIPTLAAMCYRHFSQQDFIAPDSSLDYAANFLYMMFGKKPSAELSLAMNRLFVLHADHEQNASTSTVRMVGSTGVNPFAAIAAGIAALWGPAHGGANEACLNMLRKIGSVDRIPEFIAKAKDKNDPFKLMGFGHRVYKNRDPRATFMKISCDDVLKATGNEDSPLLKVAVALEKAALADQYFVDRKLFPNVDFYSGITQTALGIPEKMFTVVFALARTTGWLAQWNELLSDPSYKIYRPRQLYKGPKERDYVPLAERKN
jgi:citrate synthase